MAEVLVSFDAPVVEGTRRYHARVIGKQANDGLWDGWIEFVALDDEAGVVATGVESRQPERAHLAYWATGLTLVYLEGALRRALAPPAMRTRVTETPATTEPAVRARPARPLARTPDAVLDPFAIGGRSLHLLRQELGALDRPRLLNIIAAYDLNPASEDLAWMSDAQLAHFIVVSVESRTTHHPR